jgi:carbon monoxide dehydrogenase subunit G
MAGFELKEWIARAPQEVFAFIADAQNAPRVSPSIQSSEKISEGSVGAGTRYRETRVMNGKPEQAELEVVRYEPPRAYAVRNVTEGIETVYTYSFVPENNGTRIDFVAQVNAGGFKKAMLPIVAGVLKKEDGDHLKRVKDALEGTA